MQQREQKMLRSSVERTEDACCAAGRAGLHKPAVERQGMQYSITERAGGIHACSREDRKCVGFQ